MMRTKRKGIITLALVVGGMCVISWKLSSEEHYRTELKNSSAGIEEQIILRESPRISLRLYKNPTYKIDVILDGHPIHRNINIGPIDREQLSVSRLLEISDRKVNWGRLLPKSSTKYAVWTDNTQQLVSQLRPLLPTLPDAEDGATDEHGRLVKIKTGAIVNDGGGFNCSGFSKWVIDGLFFPVSKRYLPIPQLKQRQLKQRGHSISALYEHERDPYFGLDWSRALASTYYQARYGVTEEAAVRAIDVRSAPYFTYIDDIGYQINDLRAVLYLLAIREPHNFYIGSLNKDSGSLPRLRQHFHIALLFPYFTEEGVFKVAVFERNKETDLSEFMYRNRDIDIHLVRVASSARFTPPTFSL